ncbi:MAG: hypothetical protein NWF05_05130 [Candidatus Bathyarchaeota archaeon]|nr:hypothetical protein [Candidatus Bathyarchaeota archaeon]
MNAKKTLQNQIRGWLPKEPSFPNLQNRRNKVHQQNKKPEKAVYIGVFAAAFAAVSITMGALQVLGAGSYASFAAGVVGGFVAVFSSVMLSRNHNRANLKGKCKKR